MSWLFELLNRDILLWSFNHMQFFWFMQVEFFDKYKVCLWNHWNYTCFHFPIRAL